jgi:hypothetical protein
LTEKPVIGITNGHAVLRFKRRITSFDTWTKTKTLEIDRCWKHNP